MITKRLGRMYNCLPIVGYSWLLPPNSKFRGYAHRPSYSHFDSHESSMMTTSTSSIAGSAIEAESNTCVRTTGRRLAQILCSGRRGIGEV